MSQQKWELKKERPEYFKAKRRPELIDLRDATYLAITGSGAPGGDEFQAKLQAMYTVAYTLKFAMKTAGRDFTVSGLEGRWWVEHGPGELPPLDDPGPVPSEAWRWTLMIAVPGFVTGDDVASARVAARAKKGLPETAGVMHETFSAGRCVQMMHVGPYSEEPASFALMGEWMAERGLERAGNYHIEVYLSDPRRTAPDRLRTILRQPVRDAA